MDFYYEKNVVNDGIDKHAKRNMVLCVLRVVAVVLIVVAVVSALYFPLGSGALGVTLSLVGILLMLSVPVVLLLMVNRIIGRLNAEYDYYIMTDIFRVVAVINRRKRRRIAEFPLSEVQNVGRVESESFDRYDADKSIKAISAACNEEADLGYMFYVENGERKLVIVELDSDFIAALRRVIPMSAIDDSIKKQPISAKKTENSAKPENTAENSTDDIKTDNTTEVIAVDTAPGNEKRPQNGTEAKETAEGDGK